MEFDRIRWEARAVNRARTCRLLDKDAEHFAYLLMTSGDERQQTRAVLGNCEDLLYAQAWNVAYCLWMARRFYHWLYLQFRAKERDFYLRCFPGVEREVPLTKEGSA